MVRSGTAESEVVTVEKQLSKPRSAAASPYAGLDPADLSSDQTAALDRFSTARRHFIAELDRAITQLQVERGRLLLEERDLQTWRDSGHATFATWRGQDSGAGRRAASTEIDVADTLQHAPAIAEAVDEGALTLEHVRVVAGLNKRAARSRAGELDATEHSALVTLAAGKDAEAFSTAANRWLASRDPVAHDADHAELRERRYLSLNLSDRGAHLRGFLDPVAGRTLALALEAATPRPAQDDERDVTQRAADALTVIAERALDEGRLKAGAATRPHVTLIMSEDTFAGAQAELARRQAEIDRRREHTGAAFGLEAHDGLERGAGTGDNESGEDTTEPIPFDPVTFDDGMPVPLTEVARLVCDCEMTRVVVDADGVPLDVGRTTRGFTAELRRAVVARDRSCRFQGCDREVRWCEIHHITWWSRGGVTSLDNALLVCSFHHHRIHDGILVVATGPDGLPAAVVNPHRPRHATGPPARGEPPGFADGARPARRAGSDESVALATLFDTAG